MTYDEKYTRFKKKCAEHYCCSGCPVMQTNASCICLHNKVAESNIDLLLTIIDDDYSVNGTLYVGPTDKDVPKFVPDETKHDPVDHPSHYTHGGMECIDEMIVVFGKGAVMDFCLLNVWKYRKRAMYKNGEEDMKKADWYMFKYWELKESSHE